MMQKGRGKIIISSLIDHSSPPTMTYWSKLLNIFEKYKQELSQDELKLLETECERCRLYFNQPHATSHTVVKNGRKVKIELSTITFNINKNEVYPNIYSYNRRER